MKIAVAGKGGVGKTTVSAELTKYFAKQGFKVYAVDADPDLSLGNLLGFPEDFILSLKPLAEMREDILAQSGGKGSFYTLNPEVENLLEKYILENGNIKFLKMGGLKHGGTSCYCRENTVLQAVISNLLLNKEEIVILDMGAGIEHLTRGTSKGVDLLLIVSEPSKTSVQSSKVIANLAEDLGIKKVQFVGNKVRDKIDYEFLKENFQANLVLAIEYEEKILHEARGEVVEDKRLSRAVEGLGDLLKKEDRSF